MEWKNEIKKCMSFRVFTIKIKKAQKRGFFQGDFGPNFQINIFFVITENKLKVEAEKIMNFQKKIHISLNNEIFVLLHPGLNNSIAV